MGDTKPSPLLSFGTSLIPKDVGIPLEGLNFPRPLSPETLRAIAEIDQNLREGQARAHTMWVG